MKKNDKLVVIIGVIVLVIASIGIYYWTEETISEIATRENIFKASGTITDDMPEAVKVSDENAFYSLIATPLAVHYDSDGEKTIKPLYIENETNPSTTVVRAQKEQLKTYDVEDLLDYENPKEMSLDIAKKYWKKSDAVLLIKENQEGYYLGVPATPLASYLSIPVIVTDEVDQHVKEVLDDLGVEISLICGDLEGYGKTFELDDIDEIMDLTIDLLKVKFKHDVDYITITNPIDAYPPKILTEATDDGVTEKSFSGIMAPASFIPSALINMIKTKGTPIEFSIPEDYKYARVIFEIINQAPGEHIEMFGDNVMLSSSLTGYITSSASPPIVDGSGELLNDRLYYEETFYDCGGQEFSFTPSVNTVTGITPEYTATVRIENLENPYQPLMKQLSSLAPYLTAYHKGVIFADPDFAFAVNEDNAEFNGKVLSGATQPRRNPEIMPVLNKHVYDNIHEPLNELLSKLTYVNISRSVEPLKEHCYDDPFYIAIVGDTTMLPQYYFRSPHSDPYVNLRANYGTNTPSDFIYANIDPEIYSMQPYQEEHVENDLYSDYPEMENIVGRITGGFDVQDTSALIARTVFYDDVLESQSSDWKDQALVMSGAGLEFQALPIIDRLYQIMGMDEPMKCPSGQQHFLGIRTQNFMEEKGGFTVEKLERGQAQRVGFSKEALKEIKQSGLLSRLLFPKIKIQFLQGLENINSLFSLEWWSKAFDDQSGIHGGESQENSNLIQVNAHGIFFDYSPGDVQMYASGGPGWQLISRVLTPALPLPTPRSGLENHGGFSVRDVSLMEMGPSVMFVECCGGGKIDSLHPYNTLSAAYLHSGINAFICPSTLSAIGGYLEPRPTRIGCGLLGYFTELKNTKNGDYVDTEFCGWIFEHAYDEMFKDDATLGEALRNARNDYLPDQIDETYLWTPPLNSEDSMYQQPAYMKSTAKGAGNVPVEKYAAIYELNLLGDPMWNPYQPVNEG